MRSQLLSKRLRSCEVGGKQSGLRQNRAFERLDIASAWKATSPWQWRNIRPFFRTKFPTGGFRRQKLCRQQCTAPCPGMTCSWNPFPLDFTNLPPSFLSSFLFSKMSQNIEVRWLCNLLFLTLIMLWLLNIKLQPLPFASFASFGRMKKKELAAVLQCSV